MKVKVYGIRNCDTMKRAFAWLDAHGVAYEFHDYRRDGVPPARLAAWSQRLGWERLANTRGTTWRKIPEDARRDLDEAQAIELLRAHPGAIRRPVVEAGGALLFGFDAAEFARVLDQ